MIADLAGQSFGVFQEKPMQVGLRFSPAATTDARRFLFHPTQATEPQQDGTLIVRLTAGRLLETAHHMFEWGAQVEVLAPASLRDKLCELPPAGLLEETEEVVTWGVADTIAWIDTHPELVVD